MADFLTTLATQIPEVTPIVQQINDNYNAKLWHNITDLIEQLLKLDVWANHGPLLMQCYTDFMTKFENRLNALRLAAIISQISFRLQDYLTPEQGLAFVDSVLDKVSGKAQLAAAATPEAKEKYERYRSNMKRDQREAELLLEIEKSLWLMKSASPEEAQSSSRRLLREVKDKIDRLGYVENIVQAGYYKAMSEWLRRAADLNEFYRHALLYLAYTPLEELSTLQQQAIAFDVGVAALLGDRIYNFGELLGHPVVESLQGTSQDWLYRLLFAFNRGNIPEYQQLTTQHSAEINQRPLIKERAEFLHEKVQIMTIMELVFQRSASDRNISFEEVARATGRTTGDVELLLLKALSLGLIRGSIDQVDQLIRVSWVQPRVLDKSQVGSLSRKIESWLNKVDVTMGDLISAEAV